MGVLVRTSASCGCQYLQDERKRLGQRISVHLTREDELTLKEEVVMDKIAEKVTGNRVDNIFKCPRCGNVVCITVNPTFVDTFKGVRFLMQRNDRDRLLVYRCVDCKKLIGTREIYNVIERNGKKYTQCEGCHDVDK